jgi:hypothetical protein
MLYPWVTTTVPDHLDCKIRVNASDGHNFGIDESGIFTIDNIANLVQISPGYSVINVSDRITVSLDVSDTVNVTIKQITDVLPPPSEVESLNIYLDITLSDENVLTELWINISLAELGEQNLGNVRIFFYSDTLERWEEVKRTDFDSDRKVVWGMMDHLTLFGVMDKGTQETGLGPILVVAFFFIAAVGLSAMFIYRRAKRRLRKELVEEKIKKITDKETKRQTRSSQLDIDILTRDFEDDE